MRKKIVAFFCLAGLFFSPVCHALPTSLSTGTESIVVEWPDAEGWGIGYQQDAGEQAIIEVIKKPETVENWTEIGTLLAYRTQDALFMNLDWEVQQQVQITQAKAKDVKFEKIWEGLKDGYDSRIYVIKVNDYPDGTSEMQIWLMMKTKRALYHVSWIRHARDLDRETIDKWVAFLRTVRITERAEPQTALPTK